MPLNFDNFEPTFKPVDFDSFVVTKPANEQGLLPHVAGRIAQGLVGSVVAGPLESIGVAASGFAKRFGDPIVGAEGANLASRPTYQLGQYLRKKTAEILPIDESRSKSWLADTLPQGFGSMVGFLAGGLAGKVAKASGAATLAAFGAGSGGADAFNEAKEKGASDDDALKVFAFNAALGTTEAVPIAGWLGRLNKASGNKLTRAIKEGSEEAIQEIFQQFGGNLVAKKYYDPSRPWYSGVIEGGAAGMTLGSLMSLVVSAVGGRRARLQQSTGNKDNAIDQGEIKTRDFSELPRVDQIVESDRQNRIVPPSEQGGGTPPNLSGGDVASGQVAPIEAPVVPPTLIPTPIGGESDAKIEEEKVRVQNLQIENEPSGGAIVSPELTGKNLNDAFRQRLSEVDPQTAGNAWGEIGYDVNDAGRVYMTERDNKKLYLIGDQLADAKRQFLKLTLPPRTTVTPFQDASIGVNAAGEQLYQQSDGQVYRMRRDRKDRPTGYPDFGGDLAVIESAKPPKRTPRKLARKPEPAIETAKPITPTPLSAAPVPGVGPLNASPWRDNILDSLALWQSKGTPQQLLAHLAKTRGAMDEASWIGLDEFLKGKATVSKDEVEQFVRANQVEVKDVVLGNQDLAGQWEELSDGKSWRRKISNRWTHIWKQPDGSAIGQGPSRYNRVFASVQEAKDYFDSSNVSASTVPTKFANYQTPGGSNYRELLLTLPGGTPIGNVTSPHFDERNILAHVRFNDRTDSDGKKVLFIEEVQSDWAAQGRKKGFRTAQTEQSTWPDLNDRNIGLGQLDVSSKGVPPGPFVTSTQGYVGLVIRRMIHYAAQHGYDKIAWTTGEMQSERYDLSNQVQSVAYFHNGDSTYRLSVMDNEGRGHALGNAVPADKLEDFVGKEVAQKIIDGVGDEVNYAANNRPVDIWKELTGTGLKVGGEGMKAFYDRILPNEVNKFVKKWGGKVGTTEIITGKGGEQVPDNAGGLVRTGAGRETVHALELTPAMRQAAEKGMPLFAKSQSYGQGSADSQPLIDIALSSGGGSEALQAVVPHVQIKYGQTRPYAPMQYQDGVITINKAFLDFIAGKWPQQAQAYINRIIQEELIHAVTDIVLTHDEKVAIGESMSELDKRRLDRPDVDAITNPTEQNRQYGAEFLNYVIGGPEVNLPIDPKSTLYQRVMAALRKIWNYLTKAIQDFRAKFQRSNPVLDEAVQRVKQAIDDINAGTLTVRFSEKDGSLNAKALEQALRSFTDKGQAAPVNIGQAAEVVASNETARRLIEETQATARGPEKTVQATTTQERMRRDIARETLAKPIIRDQMVGPIDMLNLSIQMLDGDLADFERLRRDENTPDEEVSAAGGHALDTIRQLDTATQVFNGEYAKERQLLVDKIGEYAEEELSAMDQRDVDEVLFKQFSALGRMILDQTADEAGLKALKQAQTHSTATLKVLEFLRKTQVFRNLQMDDNRSIDDLMGYIHTFITNNLSKHPKGDTYYSMIELNIGAGREAIEDVLRIVRLSEPLRTEIAQSQDIAAGRQYAQPFHKIKARVLSDIAKGNLDSAHALYEQGLVEVGITLKESRDLANFFARKLRQALVSLKALDGAKAIVDQVNSDPEFRATKRTVQEFNGVQDRTITSDGKEMVDWYDDVDLSKPRIGIVWERTLANREENVKKALSLIADYTAYIGTPDHPNYVESRAAGMRRALTYLRYYADPSQDMALGRLVPSGLSTLADHIFSVFGHPQLIPKYSFVGATGPAYTNFNLTMVALSDVLERVVAIEKQYAGRRKGALSDAVDSHNGMSVQIYHSEILDPLAASRQNFNDVHVLKVGDGIGNGHKVTKEDVEYYKIIERWQNEMLQVVNNYGQHKFESAARIFSGILFDSQGKVRFPFARGPNMLPRKFHDQLSNWIKSWEEAKSPERKMDFLNQNLTRFVISYIDGVGQNDFDHAYAYKLPMKEVLRTKGSNPIKSFMDLAERITHLHNADQDNKPVTVNEVRDTMLGEINGFLMAAKKLLPEGNADQKSQLQVTGGDSEFNAERKQAIMPLGMYNFGVVTDAEVAGAMRGAAWPFVNAHLNAANSFRQGLGKDIQQFKSDAAQFGEKTVKQQAKEEAAHGLRLYDWGQATKLLELLSNYLTQIQVAVDLSANPFMQDRPHQVLQNSIAKLVVTSLVAPLSPLTRNLAGGFAQMAAFNAEIRRLAFPGTNATGQMIAGTFKELLYLLTHEGNPGTAKIRKFMESSEGRFLTLGMSKWITDMANERRDLHDYTAKIVGVNLNQKFWENTKGNWALWRTKGVATDVMPSTMRQWLNGISLSIDTLANFIGHATVGYADSRINSASVYLVQKAEREFEEIAMRWGDKLMPNGLFPDKALARRLFGLAYGTATPATRIREWFRNAGIGPIDQLMTEYYHRMKAWEAAGSKGLKPSLFSDPQFVQTVMGTADDNNLATYRSRPPLFKQSKLHSTLGILFGYPFFLFKKLLSFTNVMNNQGFLRRHGENIPLALTIALLIAITATLGNELASKWIKRELENKVVGFPTISDAQNPTQAAQAVLFATADAVPIVGSAFNMMMGTGYAKGFDLNSQFLMLNLASDVLRTSKEAIQTGDLGGPLLKLASRYTYPLNVVGARLPQTSGLRDFTNAKNILAMGARGTGLETKMRRLGAGIGSANYTAATPILNDVVNAIGRDDTEGFNRAYNRLVDYKRRTGSLNPESAALSALRGRGPIAGVFGAKIEPDELERIYRNVSPALAKRARSTIERFGRALASVPRRTVAKTKTKRTLRSASILRVPKLKKLTVRRIKLSQPMLRRQLV